MRNWLRKLFGTKKYLQEGIFQLTNIVKNLKEERDNLKFSNNENLAKIEMLEYKLELLDHANRHFRAKCIVLQERLCNLHTCLLSNDLFNETHDSNNPELKYKRSDF